MLSRGVGEVEDGQSSQRFDDSRKGESFAGVSLARAAWRTATAQIGRAHLSKLSTHFANRVSCWIDPLLKGAMVGIDVIGYIYSEKEEESGEVILLLHTLPLLH